MAETDTQPEGNQASFGVDPEAAASMHRGDTKAADHLSEDAAKLAKPQEGADDGKPPEAEESASKSEDGDVAQDDSDKPASAKGDSEEEAGDKTSLEIDAPGDEESAAEVLPAALESYQNELIESGELSETSQATILKTIFHPDLDPEIAKLFLAGYTESQNGSIQTAANAAATERFEMAGGEENYAAMTKWASDNYSEADREAFNTAVSGGDTGIARLAVTGLAAQWAAAGVPEVPDLSHNSTAGQGGPAIGDRAAMRRAMKDPRYGPDRAYTEEVQRQVQAAKRAGTYRDH